MSAIVCGVMLSGCGGSGGSGRHLPSNDILGNLPDLIYQHSYQDSVFSAEQEAAEEKFSEPFKSGQKTPTESDWKKAKEFDDEWKAKFKEADAKFVAEIEKLKPSLIGKEIPVEMEDGVGFEATAGKIIDVGESGFTVEVGVTITNAGAPALSMLKYGRFDYNWQILDKEGNQIGSNGSASSRELGKENGATGNINLYIAIAKPQQFVNFAKIRFIKI